MIKTEEFYRNSANEEGDYFVRMWAPEGEVCGVLQIAHGMAEHSLRYDAFARQLCCAGFAVFANDHIGHGKSHMNHKGTFALSDGGFEMVMKDIKSTFKLAEELFEGVPQSLMGHSMGSILAGIYAERKLSEICALVLMGTPAPNPTASLGIFIAGRIVAKRGYEAESKFLTGVTDKACGAIGDGAQKYSWLTHDQDIVNKYYEDEYCGFAFSASANRELLKGLKEFSKKTWGQNINIPTLVIAGEQDHAGGNGKAPLHYYNALKKHGNELVTINIVPGARHEVLNEASKEATVFCLKQWLCSNVFIKPSNITFN